MPRAELDPRQGLRDAQREAQNLRLKAKGLDMVAPAARLASPLKLALPVTLGASVATQAMHYGLHYPFAATFTADPVATAGIAMGTAAAMGAIWYVFKWGLDELQPAMISGQLRAATLRKRAEELRRKASEQDTLAANIRANSRSSETERPS